MNMKRTARGLVAATLTAAAVVAVPAYAHHSFSIFDASQTKTFTGVVTRVNPDANHLQIFFAPMNEARTNVERGADGKPIIWAVEMAGSAASAQQGISVSEFPAGAVFTVSLHPLRSGDPAGAREGALYKCPYPRFLRLRYDVPASIRLNRPSSLSRRGLLAVPTKR
jgi:hypothetical protein